MPLLISDKKLCFIQAQLKYLNFTHTCRRIDTGKSDCGFMLFSILLLAFSALTLLVRRQKEHLACKN